MTAPLTMDELKRFMAVEVRCKWCHYFICNAVPPTTISRTCPRCSAPLKVVLG